MTISSVWVRPCNSIGTGPGIMLFASDNFFGVFIPRTARAEIAARGFWFTGDWPCLLTNCALEYGILYRLTNMNSAA